MSFSPYFPHGAHAGDGAGDDGWRGSHGSERGVRREYVGTRYSSEQVQTAIKSQKQGKQWLCIALSSLFLRMKW